MKRLRIKVPGENFCVNRLTVSRSVVFSLPNANNFMTACWSRTLVVKFQLITFHLNHIKSQFNVADGLKKIKQ